MIHQLENLLLNICEVFFLCVVNLFCELSQIERKLCFYSQARSIIRSPQFIFRLGQ